MEKKEEKVLLYNNYLIFLQKKKEIFLLFNIYEIP
jgi:hypothetical protein